MAAKKKEVSEETVVEVGSFEPTPGQTGGDIPEVSVPPRDLQDVSKPEEFGVLMPFAEDMDGVKFGFQEAREPTE